MSLFYSKDCSPDLIGHADVGYLSDPYKARFQIGYVFICGSTAISWRYTKQSIVATSSNHAEIIAIHETSREYVCTSGCSYGEGCHFLHYVPGYTAMSQLSSMGSNPAPPFGRNDASFSDDPAPAVKSKFCSRFNTAEGCRFGDKCHFAHSEMEVGKQVRPGYNDFQAKGPLSGFSPMVRGPGGPFKTKMCANFSKGLCTFGEKCHFAHGLNELQKPLA
ncbi:Zinc finger CCCH domain-containing protein 44 [Capsicum baccatum]|uniref:Zinc finger CCCH domain-containing protein 44 n=1 Tax=Capsicum baccatum TaxID=33114 RepID=A0A2G2XRP9_CAPBA|nr:Zinc finger CCCH domain-containing protein 44 [Capsicum baccatum]